MANQPAAGEMPDEHGAPSDALVFFGATGDLAYKQIFPALAGLFRDQGLDIPVIGVARSGDLASLRERARDSLKAAGVERDAATDSLIAHLRYVKGSDDDPATFREIRRELGAARHPLHYLAVPPPLFTEVITNLAESGCADGARVIIEKPFGHDLDSARRLNAAIHEVFAEPDVFRIDHYLGKEPVQNLRLLPVRQRVPRADLGSGEHRERRDQHAGGVRCRRPGRVLRPRRRDPRRRPEPPPPGRQPAGDGAAFGHRRRFDPDRAGPGHRRDTAAGFRRCRARPVRGLPRRQGRRGRVDHRDVCRAPPVRRHAALDGRARSTFGPASACRSR